MKNARHKDKYNAGNKIKENKNAKHKINMMLKVNKKNARHKVNMMHKIKINKIKMQDKNKHDTGK